MERFIGWKSSLASFTGYGSLLVDGACKEKNNCREELADGNFMWLISVERECENNLLDMKITCF